MTTTLSSKLVERRLNDFKRRCGEYGDAALKLAYHAALPVALNPELLHFLRINFFLDPPDPLPYTVEFEFLTSGICREIDAELYEIEPEVRDALLQGLSREYRLEQIREVATLLWQYVEHHSPWTETDRIELKRSQQLTALNFLAPEKAKEWLNAAEANASQAGETKREWFIAMRQEFQQLPDISDAVPIHMEEYLSTSQSMQLTNLFLSTFASFKISDLKAFMYQLDPTLDSIISGNTSRDILINLIQWAENYGKLRELLVAALQIAPQNSGLRSFYDQMLETPVADEISIEESAQMQSDQANFSKQIPSSQVINILNEITIVPETNKVPFPQADKFERVENLLSLLAKKDLTSEEITENYQFTLRQTQYYIGAGTYLGLISKGTDKGSFSLTDEGRNIVEKDYESKYLDLTKVILQHEVFYKVFKTALDVGRIPSNDVIVEIMSACSLNMNAVTMKRRAGTVRGWIEWIWSKIDWGVSP